MSAPMIVREGDKFYRLTVIREIERTTPDKRRFLCRCDCGNLAEVNLIHFYHGNTKSCGCIRREFDKNHSGSKNGSWKGGRRRESGGYIEVYMPSHPNARVNGYIKEHRLVMEQALGRQLLDCENVHHINGDKSDNRIENLELWNTSQPPGQRAADKLKWAKEIIELYETSSVVARTPR